MLVGLRRELAIRMADTSRNVRDMARGRNFGEPDGFDDTPSEMDTRPWSEPPPVPPYA